MKIIYRDFNRTEDDDFALNVRLDEYQEAVPLYHTEALMPPTVIGWRIQQRYE